MGWERLGWLWSGERAVGASRGSPFASMAVGVCAPEVRPRVPRAVGSRRESLISNRRVTGRNGISWHRPALFRIHCRAFNPRFPGSIPGAPPWGSWLTPLLAWPFVSLKGRFSGALTVHSGLVRARGWPERAGACPRHQGGGLLGGVSSRLGEDRGVLTTRSGRRNATVRGFGSGSGLPYGMPRLADPVRAVTAGRAVKRRSKSQTSDRPPWRPAP